MGKELFKNIPSKVGDLVNDVRTGRIGLPDLQRPFVWKDNKVRELFDSLLKGYPIGYIMLWESPVDYESKKSTIGDNSKTYEDPKELVIDGQQRLTALVAAMFAVKVKDKNFVDREIKISYNPLTCEFAVWSQAYEKDTEWISRISDVFLAKEDNSISSLRRRFIKEANESRGKKGLPLLTDEEEDKIEDNINTLLNLTDYSLPTLEISYTADEEDVADIFVRVNSGGQKLTENNFIQTLISVYENETSDTINTFAAASRIPAANTSYNTLLAIEPSHLIRMAVGVGFRRARLRYLQVGEIISEPEKQKKIWWHPHSSADRIGNATNVIFKASERLSLDESKPGAGVLRFDKKRVLTLEGATKATWTMNEVYDENHIYGKRKNNARNPDRGLYYAGIWQELGLKESDACTEWARDILK